VLVTSRIDEALGVVVPMPALPVEGNVFCAFPLLFIAPIMISAVMLSEIIFFITINFLMAKMTCRRALVNHRNM
jgi:hypothetical protein